MAILRNVAKTDTLEIQRQKINLLAADVYDYTSGSNSISIFVGQYGDGSKNSPAVTFASDTSLGFYKPSSGKLEFVSSQKNILSLSSNSVSFLRNFNAERRGLSSSGLTVTGGSGYKPGNYTDIPVLGGIGVNGTINLTVDPGGSVSAVTVNDPGSGYAIGDIINVDHSLISDSPTGVATSVTLSTAGQTYSTSTNVATQGGSGSGLTVDITTTVGGQVSEISAGFGGTGGYTTSTNVSTTTSGSGTGATLNIVASATGVIGTTKNLIGGSGYSASTVNVSGGTGSGASVSITVGDVGIITTTSVNTAGTGYTDNTNQTLTGGTGSGATVTVFATPQNSATTVSIFSPGLDYEPSGTGTATTNQTGTGSGLTINFTSNASGSIITATVNSGGSGYALADTVQLNSNTATESAVLEITGVNTGGSVTSATIISGGTNYQIGDILNISGGSGGKLNVTGITGGAINLVTIVSGGTGYTVNDTITVPGGTGGSFQVDTTTGGTITSATVNTSGSGYAINDVLTVSGGSADATFYVSSISGGAVQTVSVNSGGSGYAVGDLVIIGTNVTNPSYQAKILISDTSDGSGFSASVTSLDISNVITGNTSTGDLSAISFTGTNLSIDTGVIDNLSGITVIANTSVTTPSIISNADLNITATGNDVIVNSDNFKVGSDINLESSTGDILTNGQIRTTDKLNVSDLLTITSNGSQNIVETFDNNPLIFKTYSNKVAKFLSTSALIVPVGTQAQRPQLDAESGAIRFNTTTQQYEGYNASNSLWASLGGVRDADGNTYLLAESYSGSNDNTFYFFNNNSNTLKITTTGVQFESIDTINSTSGELNFGCNLLVDGNLKITSNSLLSLQSGLTLKPASGNNVIIDSTSSLVIPSGTTAQRGSVLTGSIRFNTSNHQFEGYGLTQWTSLGGVRDVDGNTYIVPELSAGSNENIIYFYNNNFNTLQLSQTALEFRDVRTITAIDISNINVWQPTTALTTNTLVYYGTNVYKATANYTTGAQSTAPIHTSGTVNNLQWIRTIYSDILFDNVNTVRMNSVLNVNNKLKISNSDISTVSDDLSITPFTGKNVVVSATTSLVLPSGDSTNRGTPQPGSIRFNTTALQYEGYNGTNWTTLGGVKDVDGNTYIIPELSSGSNENILYFYNDALNTIQVKKTALHFEGIDNITSTSNNLDLNVSSIAINNTSLVFDTNNSQISKIYSTQDNIDIGIVNGLNNDTFIRLTGGGNIDLNTSFGTGAYNSITVLDKSLKYINLTDFQLQSTDITLTKGTVNFGAVSLYDPTISSGCKVTVIAVNQNTGHKHMVEFNVIDKDGDIFNIEYESLISSGIIFDSTFDFDSNNFVRITTTLDSSVANNDIVKVTVLTTSIKK